MRIIVLSLSIICSFCFSSVLSLAAEASPVVAVESSADSCVTTIAENTLGRYDFGDLGVVHITLEGDKLILFVEDSGLRRNLIAANKYFYAYGPKDGTAEPVEGSFLFMPHVPDGTEAPSQLMWLHGGKKMYVGTMMDWD